MTALPPPVTRSLRCVVFRLLSIVVILSLSPLQMQCNHNLESRRKSRNSGICHFYLLRVAFPKKAVLARKGSALAPHKGWLDLGSAAARTGCFDDTRGATRYGAWTDHPSLSRTLPPQPPWASPAG